MRIIAFIEELAVIRKILKHLDLWEDQEPRPPSEEEPEAVQELEYMPCFDLLIRVLRGGMSEIINLEGPVVSLVRVSPTSGRFFC